MVYAKIKDYLCSGAVTPADIVSERDLAQKFAVKRGVAREVLIQLEGEGLVSRMPLRGYKLSDYSRETAEEIQAIRKTIEVLAAKRAAAKADREDIVRLTLDYERMEEARAEDDAEEQTRADRDFHATLVKASKSELLSNLFAFLRLPIFPGDGPLASREMLENSLEGHRLLLEAIKKRDAEWARKLMEDHFSSETVWYEKTRERGRQA